MKKWMVIGGVCLVLVAVVLVGSGCGSTKVTVNGKSYTLAEYRTAVNDAIEKERVDMEAFRLDAVVQDSAELTALLPHSVAYGMKYKEVSAWVNRPDAALVKDLKDAGLIK